MDCDRGNSEYKFYDNIGDLSVRSFWYHSNDTKRNPRVMLRSHFPINDSSGYLHTTVYLAVMLQASWHTAEGNKVKKFIEFCRVKRIIDQIMMDWKNVPTSNLLWHRSQIFPEKEQSSRNFPFANQIFWTKNTPLSLTKRIFSNDQKEQIVNNYKKLDNFHSNVTSIQLFTRIYNNLSHSQKNPVPILLLEKFS